jgi:hypothetical protein
VTTLPSQHIEVKADENPGLLDGPSDEFSF